MTNLGHILGSLLALYYLSGRWSFARLEGTYLGVSMLQQPRLWIAITFIGLATITYSETRQRCASIKPNFLDLTIISWLLYMIAAAAWSPDPQLAAEKAIELSLLLAIAVGIMLARSPLVMPQMNTAFWTALVVICVAMGGLALFMSTGGRVFVPTGGPNTFGRNMGLAGVGAIYLAARSGATVRAASVGVVAMALMSVVMCGSRGGLLAAIVATGILVVSARMRWHTKAAVLGIFAVVGAAAFTFTSAGKNALLVFQHRILHQTVEQRYLAARDDLFIEAWELAWQRPWTGWGLNGFLAQSWNYPHNIFLEAFVEGGALSLAMLLAIFVAWWTYFRKIRVPVPRIELAAISLVLTSAQVSGDFYDSRGVFLIIALSAPTLAILDRAPVPRGQRLAGPGVALPRSTSLVT